jgi:hypothetical protein
MIQKVESGSLLAMLLHGRLEYKNLANIFIYYNRLVNGIYNPSIINNGFWTSKV